MGWVGLQCGHDESKLSFHLHRNDSIIFRSAMRYGHNLYNVKPSRLPEAIGIPAERDGVTALLYLLA
jgi:hypothetical protein